MNEIIQKKQTSRLKTAAIIHTGTADKNSGMYVGEPNNPSCKENRNILITHKVYDFNDYFLKTTNEVYKRRTPLKNSDGTIAGYHEPGEYKVKKILRKYPLEKMSNLSVCWAVAADYPTVSYGMTAWRRDALIIDSDQTYNSIIEAKHKFDYFCTAFSLPKPNYILRNPSSKHIQAGWILDKPFFKRDFNIFNIYIKQLAHAYKDFTKCDGDICFNGPACKNPYYSGFEAVFPNRDIVELNSFDKVWEYTPIANKISSAINNNNNSFSSLSYNNTFVTVKQLVKATSKSGGRHYFGGDNSRDYLECKWLREWVWNEMRHDHTPTEQQARAKLREFAVAASKQTGKGLHSEAELNSKCKCTYKWAVSHFKSDVVSSKQKEGATFGNFVKKLQSYITMGLIQQYKDKHMSTREIARATGYSAMTVSRSSVSKINKKEIKTFCKYYKQSNEEFQKHYKELFTALDSLIVYINTLSSSPSYNNTFVTVQSNIDENRLKQDIDAVENRNNEIDFAEKRLKEFLESNYEWEDYVEKIWSVTGKKPVFTDYVHRYKKQDYEWFRKQISS